jgi:hypothetical protein
MPGILFEQFEILFRQPLNLFRQSAEMLPGFRRGEMRHSGRHLPRSTAREAASPSLSNLPARASAAKQFSHFAVIKSSNQPDNRPSDRWSSRAVAVSKF